MNRRSFLAGTAALSGSVLFAPSIIRAQEGVVFSGPGATPSMVLAQAIASGDLGSVVPGVTFKPWKTPDELRAGLASGSMPASVVPTYVAANFYNRGLGLRLLNVNTTGLLYVLSTKENVKSVTDLKSLKIGVPFKNDMPDYVMGRLLEKAGLVVGTDVTIEYTATPPEAVQMLMADRLDAVLTTEPAVTAALAKAKEAGKAVYRSINVSEAWTAVSGKPGIPQAGLALTGALVERLGPNGVNDMQAAMEKALATIEADPAAAAEVVTDAFGIPAPVIAKSLPFSNLAATRASVAKEDLVGFFSILADYNPEILGGKLPDDAFYEL